MIVDDNPANLKLLEDMLRLHSYEVRSFPRGRLALAAADHKPPDLILLDVTMPEMSGYEVCEQLKSKSHLTDVPVIFISALDAVEDKTKGFQSGGVDYISKPFHFEEVRARVETHLRLRSLQRELKLHNESLEATVTARTRELAEANERLTILDRSKNEFLNLISHELRTPLNGLLGVGQLILAEMPSTQENCDLQSMFEESRRRMLSMLDDALLMTEIDVNGEVFRSARVSLNTVLNRAIKETAEFAESHRVSICPPPPGPDVVLVADENLLVRALRALLETAIKFCGESEVVRISHEIVAGATALIIESQGKTVQSHALRNFFELFTISEVSTPGGDLGLRPPVAYRIFSLFGASVNIASRVPSGIRLTVSINNASVIDG
jgi:DNA-binding response OmpR family regulator